MMMVMSLLVKPLMQIRNTSLLAPFSAWSKKVPSLLDDDQQTNLLNYIQSRGAARRGKRIQRARDAKLRAAKRRLLEAQNPRLKTAYKKEVRVDKTQLRFLTERQLDSTLPNPPADDVYFTEKFRKKRFSFDEIIEFHRQAVHPDVLNKPDSLVSAIIELNLKMKIKKRKYIEQINSTVCYPHLFKYQIKSRKIVALTKDPVGQEAAKEAGAIIAGEKDVAQLLKTGQLTHRDFDHIVCHNDYLEEFAAVKGMRNQTYFPSKQRSNFGDDIVELVKFFKNGVDYSLKKNPDEPGFGCIDCYFGKLDMPNEQLRENLLTLFASINRFKPLNLADDKQFFQRVLIVTPVTDEIFVLKFWEMIDDYEDPDNRVVDDEDDDVEAKKAIT